MIKEIDLNENINIEMIVKKLNEIINYVNEDENKIYIKYMKDKG